MARAQQSAAGGTRVAIDRVRWEPVGSGLANSWSSGDTLALQRPPTVRAFLRFLPLFWLIGLMVLGSVVATQRADEAKSVASAASHAEWSWLLLAALAQMVAILAMAGTYSAVLRRLGHQINAVQCSSPLLQRAAVGTVTPCGGPAAIAACVRALGRRNVRPDDALAALGLRAAAGQAATVVFLVGLLASQGSIRTAAAAAGLIVAAILAHALGLTRRLPFRRAGGVIHRLPRWLNHRIQAAVARARQHRVGLRDLGLPFALSLVSRLAGITVLILAVYAVNGTLSPWKVFAAYCAATIAKVAVPVFGGAGVIEATTVVALRHAGLPADQALGAVLIWRLFEFWLPLAAGLTLQLAHWLPEVAPVLIPRRRLATVIAGD